MAKIRSLKKINWDWALLWRLSVIIVSIVLSVGKLVGSKFFLGYKIPANILFKALLGGVGFFMGVLIAAHIIVFVEGVKEASKHPGGLSGL